jgi:hypothetical protein
VGLKTLKFGNLSEALEQKIRSGFGGRSGTLVNNAIGE